jgi:hypothetical protein
MWRSASELSVAWAQASSASTCNLTSADTVVKIQRLLAHHEQSCSLGSVGRTLLASRLGRSCVAPGSQNGGMSEALIGFLGVVVGLAVGFGYRFWAGRRAELAAAVVNTTMLAETARALSGDPGSTATTLGELRDIWREARPTLIVLMTPADFERLSAAIASARRGSPSELVALSRSLDSLTTLLWEEHQAFILSPLLRYVRRDTLSKKISQLLDGHTPSSEELP